MHVSRIGCLASHGLLRAKFLAALNGSPLSPQSTILNAQLPSQRDMNAYRV